MMILIWNFEKGFVSLCKKYREMNIKPKMKQRTECTWYMMSLCTYFSRNRHNYGCICFKINCKM